MRPIANFTVHAILAAAIAALATASAACGAAAAGPEEQITFVYGKVTVRGWYPEPRQQ